MRQSDLEFAQSIVKWIASEDRPHPGLALVVCDTAPFMEWVMRNVDHPTLAKRARTYRLEGEDGTQIDFITTDYARKSICGRSVDKVFFSDNVPWTVYAALKPCEQSRVRHLP